MQRTRTKLTTLALVALVALASVAGAAVATAEEAPATRGTAGDTGQTEPQRGECERPPGHRFPFIRFHMNVAADAIGITVVELARSLADGMTIAEVAEANGVAVADVIAALSAPLHRKIDALVEKGCIDAETAAELKAGVTARFTEFVNNGPPDRECRPEGGLGQPIRTLFSSAADAIGIETMELVRLLADGESISSVAEANGVDVADVIAAMVAPAHTLIDRLVAEGCIDADAGERMKAKITERITELVEKTDLGQGRPRFRRR